MREQVRQYKKLTECKFSVNGANKNRTESFECQCSTNGKLCAGGSCLNRASSTECSESCSSKCQNRRIAKKENADIEAFNTGTEKGCGLRATKDINKGQFIIEYVGEVLDKGTYERRKMKYAANIKHAHFYFLQSEPFFIDATIYGNEARFANHSCDPNANCEKWVVPGTPGQMDRVGFFANRVIKKGEEITFDYQFHNYGREAHKCYCGTAKCKGLIGEQSELSSHKENDNQDIVTAGETNREAEEDVENLQKARRKLKYAMPQSMETRQGSQIIVATRTAIVKNGLFLELGDVWTVLDRSTWRWKRTYNVVTEDGGPGHK